MFLSITGILALNLAFVKPAYTPTTSTKSYVITKNELIHKQNQYYNNENMETKEGTWVNVRLSFYTHLDKGCNNITASGKQIQDGMCACPKNVPFGQKIYVPGLNKILTCEDRGGSITNKNGVMRIDVYVPTKEMAFSMGVKFMKAKLLK